MELLVDSLTKQYLADVLKESVVCVSQQILDAKVSGLRLRILQNILGVNEAMAPTLPGIPLYVSGNSRIISDLVISLHDLTVCFSACTDSPRDTLGKLTTFRGSLSRIKAHVDTSPFHRLSQMNRTPKISRQCTLEIDESRTIYTSNNFHMTLGDARAQLLGKASLEILTVTLDSLVSFFRETATQAPRTCHLRATRQHQFRNILESCRSTVIEDPLTLIQPSILVQRGRPLRLRRDPTWKLFMYLRHCLRFHTVSELVMVTSPSDGSLSSVQMDDLFTILHERLAGWSELPRQEVARLPFVQYCFGSMVHSSVDKSRDPYAHLPILAFHTGTFIFSVFERSPSLGNSNTLTLGPFHLVYRYRKQQLKTLPVKMSGTSVGPFLDPTSIRHHILSATVEDVRYTIHPSFIIFLQRLLWLHGKFGSTKPTTASPVSDGSQRSDDYLECFVEVQHISIQAAVEGMVLSVGLTNVNLAASVLYAAPTPRSQPRLRRFISGNCLIKSHQLYTHVRQAYDEAEPFRSNGRDVLTGLAFSSLAIDTSCRMTGEHPPVIHGLLTMDSLMLNVPRSALLTYRLIEEWRTQYLP